LPACPNDLQPGPSKSASYGADVRNSAPLPKDRPDFSTKLNTAAIGWRYTSFDNCNIRPPCSYMIGNPKLQAQSQIKAP
jgi:hypothetical protein